MTTIHERLPAWLFLALIFLLLSPTAAPRSLSLAIVSAHSAWESGQPLPALAAVEAALLREPVLGASLHLAAARAALEADNPEAAASHSEQAIAFGAPEAEAHCLLLEAELVGNGSLQDWTRGLSACEFSPRTLRRLADTALADGDALRSRAMLEALVRARPGDRDARLNLGLLQAVTDPEASLSHLEASIALAGGVLPIAETVAEVIRNFPKASSTGTLFAQVGLHMARGNRWQLAEIAFAQAVHLEPGSVFAHAYLGLARDQIGKDGLSELRQALRLSPGSAVIHAWLGRHWQSRGDLATALAEFETAAVLSPDDPALAAQLGEIYSSLGDLEAAEAAYRAAVDRAPTDAGFWLLLAQHALGNEVKVDALGIPSARNVVRLDPDLAAGWDALGFGHLLLGDTEVAGRLLRRALASDPSSAPAHYHLGLLFWLRNEPDLAAAEWNACLSLDPEGPYGELARRALQGH